MPETLSSSPVAGPSTHDADIERPKPFGGHARAILAVGYSPDGKQIVTGGWGPFMRIWDSDTGEMVLESKGAEAMATSICFSSDGKRLVSGHQEGGVYIWDTCDGQLVSERANAHRPLYTMACSPDGQCIANGSIDRRVQIHAEDMTKIREIPEHPRQVQSIAFSPDGLRLATGCGDCKVRIFDVATGTLIVGPLEGHTGHVRAVAWSPDGNQIASCSNDRTIRIWDASTGSVLLGPLKGHTHPVVCMAYSPDGKKLLGGSRDGTTRLWDSHTGRLIGGPVRGHEWGVRAVSFAPDGGRFVTGASDGSIRLWDAHTQEVLLPELTEDEKERYRLTGPFRGHTEEISAVAYFPDGTRIASASHDHTIRIWDAHTGRLLVGPLIEHFRVNSIAISSDGERLVSGTRGLRIWDTRTGNILLRVLGKDVSCVQFSPDGRFIASSFRDDQVLLYDSQSGEQLRSMEGYKGVIRPLSFSPDGRRLAGGRRAGSIYVWDVSSGKLVAEPFQGHTDYIKSLAFSPDGLRIVSGSKDTTVRVWDANTGVLILGPFQAHSRWVFSVAYSPDGSRICSTSTDGMMCLWDATTGDLVLGPLQCHKKAINSAAFSPDGKHIVTGSDDFTIKFWDASTGEAIHFPDFGHEHRDPSDSFLDLPATIVPGQALRDQSRGIMLGSLPDLPAAARDDVMTTSGPAQGYRRTPFSFSRLRSVFASIFRSSRPRSDEVELEERRHRPFSRARVAYAEGKSLVHIAGGKKPRQQEMRDVSDDGSATDPAGDGDQNMAGAQGDNNASTSAVQQTEATNDAAPQTRHEGEHGPPSMERSAPYSAAPGIRFAADSVESEDSFETDCCACCPSWCTCLHP